MVSADNTAKTARSCARCGGGRIGVGWVQSFCNDVGVHDDVECGWDPVWQPWYAVVLEYPENPHPPLPNGQRVCS